MLVRYEILKGNLSCARKRILHYNIISFHARCLNYDYFWGAQNELSYYLILEGTLKFFLKNLENLKTYTVIIKIFD